MEILIFQKKSSVETTPQNSPKKKRKVYGGRQPAGGYDGAGPEGPAPSPPEGLTNSSTEIIPNRDGKAFVDSRSTSSCDTAARYGASGGVLGTEMVLRCLTGLAHGTINRYLLLRVEYSSKHVPLSAA